MSTTFKGSTVGGWREFQTVFPEEKNGAWIGPYGHPGKVFAKRMSEQTGRRIYADDLIEKPGVKKYLTFFDKTNAQKLNEEARQLADGGTTGMANTQLPSFAVRAIIKEALSDLNALDLCTVITDPKMGMTVQIPYERRLFDTNPHNTGVVYEGQPIPRGSIQQGMVTAYVNATKLSFALSHEADWFSRRTYPDWNLLDRLIASNARIVRELIHARICNELLRASDAYGAVAVTGENIASQLNGSTSRVKAAHFPIVRPHQQRDLQGTVVGAEENPIQFVLNGAPISELSEAGGQAAGVYWTLNQNLGLFALTDAGGFPVMPTASSTCTISYTHGEPNTTRIDSDGLSDQALGDRIVQAIGTLALSVLHSKRYARPNFGLCCPTLANRIENSKYFEAEFARPGTEVAETGGLTVKGVPLISSNAPGSKLKGERLILGTRGVCGYGIAKPWSTVPPFEAAGSGGLPSGELLSYGEEYSTILVPPPVRYQLSSLLIFSASERAAL